MISHYPKLKAAATGKGLAAGSTVGTGVLFGSAPCGFQLVYGTVVGMGFLFPLALAASVGYLGYRACVYNYRKIPGSGFNPAAPAADRALNDGRIYHPSETTLVDACRNIVGS